MPPTPKIATISPKTPATITDRLRRIQENLKVPKGQRNTFGNYSYRSCEDILNAVKHLAVIHEVAVILTDELINIGDRFYVKATAKITDGKNEIITTGYAREEETKKGMDGSQITGAASSYARKYALNGLFAIDDAKDSDATNNGQSAPPAPNSPPAAQSWINLKSPEHKKIIVTVQKQTNTSGENLVKELRKQFAISKAAAVEIGKWEPPPPEIDAK